MANALSGSDELHPLKENHKKENLSIESLFQILKPAVLVLLEKGIKVVLVTLGSSGVFLCSKGGPSCFKIPVAKTNRSSFSGQLYNAVMHNCPPNCYSGFSEHDRSNRLFAVHLPSLPASVVRLTGAGDCLVGGTLSSICAGLDIMRSVCVGIAAAKAAVEVESNVPSAFSLTAFAGHCDTQVSIASFQAGKMKMLSHAFYTSLGAYFLRYQLESNQSIFTGSNSLTWQMIYIGSYYFSLVFRLKQILDQPESDT